MALDIYIYICVYIYIYISIYTLHLYEGREITQRKSLHICAANLGFNYLCNILTFFENWYKSDVIKIR